MSTLKEVADLAGVSPITVSRVINNPNLVKEKTRLRIETAMAQLRYSPHLAAKNLAASRSGIIDVFIPESIDLSNPFVMHLIAGVSKVLSEHYYSFLILRNRKKEHLCDGYIVTGLLKNEIKEFAQYAQERCRPVVLFGHTSLPDIDCIDVDNIAGGQSGTQHLIDQGHKKIAMINVLEDKDYTADRLDGYKQALQQSGLAYDPSLVFYTVNSVEGGESIAAELTQNREISAVFCATDTIAIGVASKLKMLGYSIPEDFSLVGYDGLGHQMLAKPQLTTIHQPIYNLGMMLAESLIERLNGRTKIIKKTVPPKLLLGNSVQFIKKQI